MIDYNNFKKWLSSKHPDIILTSAQDGFIKAHLTDTMFIMTARASGKTYLFNLFKEFIKDTSKKELI